jgi:hypothetical protein
VHSCVLWFLHRNSFVLSSRLVRPCFRTAQVATSDLPEDARNMLEDATKRTLLFRYFTL